MPDWITTDLETITSIVTSCLLIFFALAILTRSVGLRSFSKMNAFDFAMTIAVGSIMASVILSKSTSVGAGVTALVAIFALQLIIALLRKHTKWAAKILENKPKLLMRNGEIIHANLTQTRVTESDLIAKLREANVLDFSEVRAVVLETTGDISVLHSSDADTTLSDKLLDSVEL